MEANAPGLGRMFARMAAAKTFGRIREDRKAKRSYWSIEATIEGERFQIRRVPVEGGLEVRIHSREFAAGLLEEIRAQIRAGSTPRAALAPFLGRKSTLSLERAWERFVAAKRAQAGLSVKRLQELAAYPGRGYFLPLEGVAIHLVGYAELEDLRDWLSAKRGLAPKTVRNTLADLGTCLRWLKRRGELRDVPEIPAVRVPEYAPRIPAPEAQDRILAAIPWEERGLFLARGYMGLRPSEARRARVGDWDPERRLLTVRGKGGRVRYLPADDLVAEWIAEHIGERERLSGGPLFRNPTAAGGGDGEWSLSASRRTWRAACRRVGAVDTSGRPIYRENEGLRHAFGTHAVNRGVPLDRAGAYLGHSERRTTERYAKLAGEGLSDVLRPSGITAKKRRKVGENKNGSS